MNPDSNLEPHVPAYILKTNFWISIAGLIAIPPFAIYDIFIGRLDIALATLPGILFLMFNAYSTYNGRYNHNLVLFAMTTVALLALLYLYTTKPLHGAFWCYVFIVALYATLPEKRAWTANIVVLMLVFPLALFNMAGELALRNIITLITISVFVAIFVRIIIAQEKKLLQMEKQRRESMANASHELRTPLATLVAQVEAMNYGIRNLDHSQLGVVSRSIDHITGLVDDLYLLSLSDVGKLEFKFESQRLDEIVMEKVAAMNDKFNEHDKLLKVSELPIIQVFGDGKRLSQIIENILENCYRYSDDGAEIIIDASIQNDEVRLAIEDNGPGVNDEVLAHLFDRFYRADKSRSRNSGGSGLGLSLVRAFVEAQNGKVEAYHSPQGGLGIAITLPLPQNL